MSSCVAVSFLWNEISIQLQQLHVDTGWVLLHGSWALNLLNRTSISWLTSIYILYYPILSLFMLSLLIVQTNDPAIHHPYTHRNKYHPTISNTINPGFKKPPGSLIRAGTILVADHGLFGVAPLIQRDSTWIDSSKSYKVSLSYLCWLVNPMNSIDIIKWCVHIS